MTEFKRSLKFYGHYFKKYTGAFLFILVLLFILTTCQVKAPDYLGRAINELGVYTAKYHIFKQHHLPTSLVTKNAFFNVMKTLLSFYIINYIATLCDQVLFAKISARSANDMRKGLFGKLEKLTIKFFDTHSDGDILSRFTSDLDNIYSAINQTLAQLFYSIALIIAVTTMMFQKNVRLAWVTLAAVPVAIIIAIIIIVQARKYVDAQQTELGKLNGYINERISGQKLIIVNSLQEETIDKFEDQNQKVKKVSTRGQVFSGLLFPVMQGMSLINVAVVIYVGSSMAMNGDIKKSVALGLIVTFVQYSQMFYQQIANIASSYNMIQLAMTGANRVMEVHEQPEEVNPENGKLIDGVHKDVVLDDVHFGYSEDKEILHGIDIKAEKGQTVAIVGPTGSGKTTTINLMNRFYDVNSGSIKFDGTDVREMDLPTLRKHVGIVLQDSVLFDGTIRENIAYGKKDATDEEVVAAAKAADIHEFIESLDDGYDTHISEENNMFSTGQKQLISIARTMITDPSFLILDEATSNVDTVTESQIQKAMDGAIAGRTSFVIAHRLKTIINADKIIVLKDGNIIEQGNHEELLKENGFYAEMYNSQFSLE